MKIDLEFISTPFGRFFQNESDTEEWVNFMWAVVDKDTELYAEIPLPSELFWKDPDEFQSKHKLYRFDVDSFFLLKKEILAQAKELGISEDVFQLHPDQCFGMDKFKDFEDYKQSDDYKNNYLPVKPLILPYLMCSNRTGASPISIRGNQEYIARRKDPYMDSGKTMI